MATSGITAWNRTATELIAPALRIIGALASEETATAAQAEDCRVALNGILKRWQAEGIGLWFNQEVVLYLQDGETQYSIGSTGDYCTATPIETELAADASTGDLTITVDSYASMSDGYYIGIELDDGTLQWSTINGTPASTTVTIDDALTDDAATDNVVYVVAVKTPRPVEIIEVRRVDHDGIENPLECISRDEYMRIPDKDSAGTPTQYYYDPQLTNGYLNIWPAPDDVTVRLYMTVRRPIEIINSIANDFDIPNEWYQALKWALASEMAPEWQVDLNRQQYIDMKAAEAKAVVDNFDRGHDSYFFQPDLRW